MPPDNNSDAMPAIDIARITQRAGEPHLQPIVMPEQPTGGPTLISRPIVRGGEAMTPLKEQESRIGIRLQAGPIPGGITGSWPVNHLQLGGEKHPGRIEIGTAGATFGITGGKGPAVSVDGGASRFVVSSDVKTQAYFGLGPALLGNGGAPMLVFLDDHGKLRNAFTDGLAITQAVLAGAVTLGGTGFGAVAAQDGSFSLVAKNGKHSLSIKAANALLDASDYTAKVALQETRVQIVGGVNGADGAKFVRNAANQNSFTIIGTTGDIVLAAADCAEEFDIEENADLVPGSVAILATSGWLSECREAYNTRAVGVVSGAGGYRPGLVLDRQPMQACQPRRSPIALMGKVFCRTDARHTPVRPGDLLTTAALPDHAMVVPRGEKPRAAGAILGKALAALEGGTGLLPILVAQA